MGVSVVAEDWQELVAQFRASPQGQALTAKLIQAKHQGCVIYPPSAQRLRALALTPLAKVRVLILGQDPYHGPGQAEGLAFSVSQTQTPPPSLCNIFKEIKRSLGHCQATSSLVAWAAQGVLLLNTSLSVEARRAGSHAGWGWEVLTDAVVQAVAAKTQPVAFMLWGKHAQSKLPTIKARNQDDRHLVLCANHPSPFSAEKPPVPFLGCGHFLQEARWAKTQGYPQLQW